MASDPIPRDLEQAFAEALAYFAYEWSAADPGVERISIERRGHSVRGVCGLVVCFDDQLPESVRELLFKQMHAQHDDLRADLAKSATYAVGARCLMRLLDDRVAEYQRLEELRRQRQ